MKSQDTLINPYVGSIIYVYLYLNAYKTLILVFHDWQRAICSNKYTRKPKIGCSAGGTVICCNKVVYKKRIKNISEQYCWLEHIIVGPWVSKAISHKNLRTTTKKPNMKPTNKIKYICLCERRNRRRRKLKMQKLINRELGLWLPKVLRHLNVQFWLNLGTVARFLRQLWKRISVLISDFTTFFFFIYLI